MTWRQSAIFKLKIQTVTTVFNMTVKRAKPVRVLNLPAVKSSTRPTTCVAQTIRLSPKTPLRSPMRNPSLMIVGLSTRVGGFSGNLAGLLFNTVTILTFLRRGISV